MIIGVDLDDVLMEFNEAMCRFHNREYGTSYQPSDVTTYNIENIWGCSWEEARERIGAFYESPDHAATLPVRGAKEALTCLKQKHKLYIVSAKPESLRAQTELWLEKYFNNLFDGVHFTNHVFGDTKKSKVDVCAELGIEIFVEDSMDNARNISESGRPVFLLDRPWNQGELPPGVTRVYTWSEIERSIDPQEAVC